MAFVGLFLGGSPGALIASGQAVLNLQWQAENRQDISGASFTVTGPGVSKTLPARADGRAEVTVPVGTYTISVTHTGAYLGDDPVQVVAESQKSYMVFFDGKVDRTAELDALDKKITDGDNALNKKITDGDNALSRRIDGKLGSNDTAVRATADANGDRIDTTYLKADNLDPYAKKSEVYDLDDLEISGRFYGLTSDTLVLTIKMGGKSRSLTIDSIKTLTNPSVSFK